MGLKAKKLEKLFFGSIGGSRTIMNALCLGPTDEEIERDINDSIGVPLRLVQLVQTSASDVDDTLEEAKVDTIGTKSWSRSATGVFHCTLSDIEIARVLDNKTFYYDGTGTFLGWVTFSKISQTVFAMSCFNASGVASDTMLNDYIDVELFQD